MKKRSLLLLVLFGLAMTGCGSDPAADRIWLGTILRTADGEPLSEVCLKMSGDSLCIFSNAIFGTENRQLVRQSRKKEAYTFVGPSGTLFPMTMNYSADKTTGRENLVILGPDYRMTLEPAAETDFTPEMLSFYRDRSVPSQARFHLAGRWTGEIYRIRDGQRLSDVCVDCGVDTIKVYANAIFGKTNETLLYEGFRDGSYRCVSTEGEAFRLRPNWEDGQLVLTESDFSMTLAPLQGDWESSVAFYRALDVPRSADGYLFGTYVGRTRMQVPLARTLGVLFGMDEGFMDGQLTTTLEFQEGNRCRCQTVIRWTDRQMQNLMLLSGKGTQERISETHTYKVDGNKVIFDKNGGTYYIREDGSLRFPGEIGSHVKTEDMILFRQ